MPDVNRLTINGNFRTVSRRPVSCPFNFGLCGDIVAGMETEDLFAESAEIGPGETPLARRMSPRALDELVGQSHIIGPGRLLRRAIEADRVTSLILFGPPGVGKTALARIIARRTSGAFEPLNAVTSGVKQLRELIAQAKQRKKLGGRKTIVFVDEIHRFNKAQQDALLPDVEHGTITLVGATTQNPYFSVTAPLLSRSQIFELHPLSIDDIRVLLDRAASDKERGFPDKTVDLRDEAADHFAEYCNGDARRALNALEVAVLTTDPDDAGVIVIDAEVAEESIQKKAVVYDGTGDEHYDVASAFIKSMRGSDPDSALYWLAKMLNAGEDPRFIARRIAILAAEDVGLADPQALVLANATVQVCEFIGMPEAQIPLAEATVYVASAPKSNASYMGLNAALKDVREQRSVPVPKHLQDSHYPGAERLGRGKDYVYPHDRPGGYTTQYYGVPRGSYYTPTKFGFERKIAERLEELKKIDDAAATSDDG
jgi:putative ATPase